MKISCPKDMGTLLIRFDIQDLYLEFTEKKTTTTTTKI